MKFLCDQCKAKYQIADDKVVGKTVRMKCRKCGHFIEVSSEVGDSSTTSNPAPEPAARPFSPSRPPPKPAAPPRAPAKPGAGLTPARPPPPRPERAPSALAGAFKSSVQREEEISAPFDMSEFSAGDDWYVAVNGVPVGPIRVAEVRRKAALGAVTEDSLAWQEGLDEWRPVKTFPELAAVVRDAAATGRVSFTPAPPEGRASAPPPMRPRAPTPSPGPSRVGLPRPLGPSARSNVVAITSRVATAERLSEAPDPFAGMPAAADAKPQPSVAPDPFAAAAAIAPAGAAAPIIASPVPPTTTQKSPPWMAIGMIAAFMTFGMTAAIILLRPAQSPPPSVVVQMPSPPATVAQAATASAPAANQSPDPVATPAATITRGPSFAGGPKPAPAASGPTRSLDLHGLAQNAPNPGVGEDPGSESPAAGQCFSGGQVQQVIGMHQLAIRRACWERNPTTKPTVNIAVSMTIGSDGSAQSVVASGDELSVAKCIENDVRGWRFPAMGCSQKTSFSFKFVRQ